MVKGSKRVIEWVGAFNRPVYIWVGVPPIESRFSLGWGALETWFFLINRPWDLKIRILHGRIIQENVGEISVAHFWSIFVIFCNISCKK